MLTISGAENTLGESLEVARGEVYPERRKERKSHERRRYPYELGKQADQDSNTCIFEYLTLKIYFSMYLAIFKYTAQNKHFHLSILMVIWEETFFFDQIVFKRIFK